MENEPPTIPPQPDVIIQPAPSFRNSTSYKIFMVVIAVLFFTGGAVGIYVQLAPKPQTTALPLQTQPQPTPRFTLSLISPSLNTVAENRLLTVTGTTLPDTSVVLMTETHDADTQSDDQGNFTGEIELDSGINNLTVTALKSDGQEKSLTQEVVFDDQVLGDQTESKPNLFIEDSLLSISRRLEVDKNTQFTNERNKPVKSSSVKPDDRVMAITEDSDDSTTNSARLKKVIKIITRSATDSAYLKVSKRRAIQGVVANISGSTILLTHQTQRDRIYQVTFNDQTIIASPSTSSANLVPSLIQVGQRIIVIGNVTDTGVILATRIRIIPGKATGIFTRQPITPYPTSTPAPTNTPTPTP